MYFLIFSRLINIHIYYIETTEKKNFLDLLLKISEEYPDQMTDKDIREEVDTFLFAGHDTSSISMTITLLLLGMYQDIQVKFIFNICYNLTIKLIYKDKSREELQNIFGDSNRDATMDDLKAMQYLDAIIKESLRLYPSVPVILRQLHATLKLSNNILLVK